MLPINFCVLCAYLDSRHIPYTFNDRKTSVSFVVDGAKYTVWDKSCKWREGNTYHFGLSPLLTSINSRLGHYKVRLFLRVSIKNGRVQATTQSRQPLLTRLLNKIRALYA